MARDYTRRSFLECFMLERLISIHMHNKVVYTKLVRPMLEYASMIYAICTAENLTK